MTNSGDLRGALPGYPILAVVGHDRRIIGRADVGSVDRGLSGNKIRLEHHLIGGPIHLKNAQRWLGSEVTSAAKRLRANRQNTTNKHIGLTRNRYKGSAGIADNLSARSYDRDRRLRHRTLGRSHTDS